MPIVFDPTGDDAVPASASPSPLRARRAHPIRQRPRLPSPSSALLMAGVAAILLAAPARSQLLEGRILDGTSRASLSRARVTLLHPDGRPVGPSVDNASDGSFALDVPGVGDYYIRVERDAYTPIVEGIFEFTGPDGRMSVDVFLLPRPMEIEGIEVRVQRERVRRKLRRSGFYDRAAEGYGDFVTPETIERVGSTMNVSEYMRGIPGVSFSGGLVLFKSFRSSGGPQDAEGNALGMCEPNIWVDGIRMASADDFRTVTGSSFGDGFEDDDLAQSLDDYVAPQDVIAIEVYRRVSATPLEWGGVGSLCGTIVIWTKAGTG
jgi:hypothetical protein